MMRRKEREIADFKEIVDVLERCDTIRLGICDDETPYVVPVSYGVMVEGNSITLYFHGAKAGHKAELLKINPKICFEADIFYKTEETETGITARYESVIGTGIAELVSDDEERILGLAAILNHYGYFDYPVEQCKGMDMTAVYKITVDKLTGKRNLSSLPSKS